MKVVVHVDRKVGDALAVLAEEIGFSDPDKLKEKDRSEWPEREKRTPRRGCLTLDRRGAGMLQVGTEWMNPYVKVDTWLFVEMPALPGGQSIFRVTEIVDLNTSRPEGGAHLFLEEVVEQDPNNPEDHQGPLVLSPTPQDQIAFEQAVADEKFREENEGLGTLEELV